MPPKILRVRVFLLALFIATCNVAAQTTVGSVFKKVAPATVLIKTNKGSGTGFIVSSTGMIVTAYHVVDSASNVSVRMQSGDIFENVDLVAMDERKDIALLKIPGFALPTVALGNSNDLSPGDKVIVVGNPLGKESLVASVSDGILSGVRDLGEGFKVLQLTAPVSPGDSGGAVYSSDGLAIGVISFKLARGEALNFAIPINYVRGLLTDADTKKPVRSWSRSAGQADAQAVPTGNLEISGMWKASDGQLLRFRYRGKNDYLVLNLTYPEVDSRAALMFGEFFWGIIFNGGLFGRDKYFLMKLHAPETLHFYFFENKSKETDEQLVQRAKEKFKKKPDTVLVKID